MESKRDFNLINELVKIADGVTTRRVNELWDYIVPHLKEAAYQGKYVAIIKFNPQEFNINDILIDALDKKCKYHGIIFNSNYSFNENNEIESYSLRFDFKKSDN